MAQQSCSPYRIGRHHCELSFDVQLVGSLERIAGEMQPETDREETLHPGISGASPSVSGTYTCSVSEPALLNMKH